MEARQKGAEAFQLAAARRRLATAYTHPRLCISFNSQPREGGWNRPPSVLAF